MQVCYALLRRRRLRAVPEQLPKALSARPAGMRGRLEEQSLWYMGERGACQG